MLSTSVQGGSNKSYCPLTCLLWPPVPCVTMREQLYTTSCAELMKQSQTIWLKRDSQHDLAQWDYHAEFFISFCYLSFKHVQKHPWLTKYFIIWISSKQQHVNKWEQHTFAHFFPKVQLILHVKDYVLRNTIFIKMFYFQ